ncbi:lysozyme [Actinobacillus genomosp. 2]|uniref:lysozyme n=1 Tax=Actinobacillus genomosp. 2 TaxID=230709 RepID=UPI002443188A|nr:lysozyme [Actinobacillus genomosp. 2]WGE32553.1 lysozyme [Actinobacillus genomosp. 2]
MKVSKKFIACSVVAVLAILHQLPQANEIRTSKEMLSLIANAEGCASTPYRCPADVWTDGIGNTRNVTQGRFLTLEEIAGDYIDNIKIAEQCVNRKFNGEKMTQGQFDAMTSLVFNVGCYGTTTYYSKSAGKRVPTSLYKYAQTLNFKAMCTHINDFNKAGGKVLKGLVTRRAKETEFCIK